MSAGESIDGSTLGKWLIKTRHFEKEIGAVVIQGVESKTHRLEQREWRVTDNGIERVALIPNILFAFMH